MFDYFIITTCSNDNGNIKPPVVTKSQEKAEAIFREIVAEIAIDVDPDSFEEFIADKGLNIFDFKTLKEANLIGEFLGVLRCVNNNVIERTIAYLHSGTKDVEILLYHPNDVNVV